MRAQAGFEFYFAIVAFVSVVVYIFLQLTAYYPSYFRQIKYETLKLEAWQLSELLINDPGEPINWVGSTNIKRLGLNDETKNQTNLISYEKAIDFNTLCNSNYRRTLEMLGTNYTLSVYLFGSDGETIISCSHPHSGTFVVNVTRIVAIHRRDPEKTWWGELTLQLS